jgi:hypothetical protein
MIKIFLAFVIAIATTSADAYTNPKPMCRAETLLRAEKLLALQSENDERRELDETRLKRLPPLKDPAGDGALEVEEVWAYVYKGEYRMRFTYRMSAGKCVLIGEEIIEY